jgi:hypothetical protein
MIEAGKHLVSMKERVKKRGESWEEFVVANLFVKKSKDPLRTAQRYMRAAEIGPDLLLAGVDPAEILARIWGNEKRRNVVSGGKGKKADDDDKEQDDEETGGDQQSGGPGFSPGFFEDKKHPGKLIFAGMKGLTEWLDRMFLKNEAILPEGRVGFIDGLIRWLEGRRASLAPVRTEEKQATE